MELIFRGINFREFVIFKEFHRINFREVEVQNLRKLIPRKFNSVKINSFKVANKRRGVINCVRGQVEKNFQINDSVL